MILIQHSTHSNNLLKKFLKLTRKSKISRVGKDILNNNNNIYGITTLDFILYCRVVVTQNSTQLYYNRHLF